MDKITKVAQVNYRYKILVSLIWDGMHLKIEKNTFQLIIDKVIKQFSKTNQIIDFHNRTSKTGSISLKRWDQ